MRNKSLWFFLAGMLTLALAPALGQVARAAEKLKFSSSIKTHPLYVLPILAAEEKGFWRQQGIDMEWVPIGGGGPMFRAVAAGSVFIGMSGSLSATQARARGIPVIIVADLQSLEPFLVWARADSPIQSPKDLKGTKLAVSSFGEESHAMGRLVAKALGLGGDIKFVA